MPFTLFGKKFGKETSNRYKFEGKGAIRTYNPNPSTARGRSRTRRMRRRRGRGATKKRRKRAKYTR